MLLSYAGRLEKPSVETVTGPALLGYGLRIAVTGNVPHPLPPHTELTTAQQLALSVLVGEPDRVVLSALCDLLIEQGHEYAVAVAEKARREERERCRKLVASLADAAMWAGDSSHGVLYSLCDDL